MRVFVKCSVCDRVMVETTLQRGKKFKAKHGDTCLQCIAIMQEIEQHCNKLKKINVTKMEDYFAKMKADLSHEIQRIAKMPPKKKTLWDWIAGIFVKGRIEIQEDLPIIKEGATDGS